MDGCPFLMAGSLPVNLRDQNIIVRAGILVALHGVRLATSSLSIDEDSGVKAHQDLLDEIVGPRPPEDALLRRSFFENLIERVALFLVLLVKNSVGKI